MRGSGWGQSRSLPAGHHTHARPPASSPVYHRSPYLARLPPRLFGSCLLLVRPELLLLTEEATRAPEGARILAALAADAALSARASLAPQELVHSLSDTLTPQVRAGR